MKEEIKAVLRSYNLQDNEIELMSKDIILALAEYMTKNLGKALENAGFDNLDVINKDIVRDLLGGMVKEKN